MDPAGLGILIGVGVLMAGGTFRAIAHLIAERQRRRPVFEPIRQHPKPQSKLRGILPAGR